MLNKKSSIKSLLVVAIFLSFINLNFVNTNSNAIDINVQEDDYIVTTELNYTVNNQIVFSTPSAEAWGDYILAKLNETNNFMRDIGKPMLPLHRVAYNFPLGSIIKKVDCAPFSIKNMSVSKKIKPASNVWYIPALNTTVPEKIVVKR